MGMTASAVASYFGAGTATSVGAAAAATVASAAVQSAKEQCPHAVFIAASDRLGLETLRHQLLNLVHYATGG